MRQFGRATAAVMGKAGSEVDMSNPVWIPLHGVNPVGWPVGRK